MDKYLYGAAVQGIQSFIFQTNALKEIVGASELVEDICTTKFQELLGHDLQPYSEASGGAILNAAGNIKYIFLNKNECQRIVSDFPKFVAEYAPGITISQAVVKMSNDNNFENAINLLEKKLRIQRNKPMRSSTLGLIGIQRSRQTGLPIIVKPNDKGEFKLIDNATWAKLYHYNLFDKTIRKKSTLKLCRKAFCLTDNQKSQLKEDRVAFDIEDITKHNNWIAIIHADGNGLGQVVQKVGNNPAQFKQFSQNLDKATTEAAVEAFMTVKQKFGIFDDERIPIRPIVLGGDDLTVICRGDLALDYTKIFLEKFEQKTQHYLHAILTDHNVFSVGEIRDRLTACAGICYIKASFPFYFGYELAEELCKHAKKDAKAKDSIKEGKELPASCLMFHKVQDSFTEDYNQIVARELRPASNISFQFGPYYLKDKEGYWSIDYLQKMTSLLESNKGNTIKSHIRNWMSLLHENPEMAKQKLDRLKQNVEDNKQLSSYVSEITEERKRSNNSIFPVYDMLSINTINNQITNTEIIS